MNKVYLVTPEHVSNRNKHTKSNSTEIAGKLKHLKMAPTKEEIEEHKHFMRVINAYRNYLRDSKERLYRTKDYYKRIPPKHKELLKLNGFGDNLEKVEKCLEINGGVISELVDGVEKMFENQSPHQITDKDKEKDCALEKTALMDMEKVQSTLKQFVRDWSGEGQKERDQCYKPILDEIENIFGHLNSSQKSSTNILVPGAGLGRLAFEIALRGYVCQGNEFSLFMLIASNFVLNRAKGPNSCTIYPWVHQYTNNLAGENQTRPVTFPDIDPLTMPKDANFSMVAGDFLEVYAEDKYEFSQDCVITCFFIDCAHNVIEFIELIHRILKKGGKWINFGPLLYHFSDVPRESSIEPSYDIVRKISEQIGFEFLREEIDVQATYCQNPTSMLQYNYKCVSFTCVKK